MGCNSDTDMFKTNKSEFVLHSDSENPNIISCLNQIFQFIMSNIYKYTYTHMYILLTTFINICIDFFVRFILHIQKASVTVQKFFDSVDVIHGNRLQFN